MQLGSSAGQNGQAETVIGRAMSPEPEANVSQNTDTMEPEMEEVSAEPDVNTNDANNADTTLNKYIAADFHGGAGDVWKLGKESALKEEIC